MLSYRTIPNRAAPTNAPAHRIKTATKTSRRIRILRVEIDIEVWFLSDRIVRQKSRLKYQESGQMEPRRNPLFLSGDRIAIDP